MTTLRSNGRLALRELPIKFKRRPGSPGFEKIVGKSTERSTHSPHEYVSEDGRWIIRSVSHSGYGSTNSGRTRWHVTFDGRYFDVRSYGGGSTLSLEDAIDEIHHRIGKGVCDGFKVLVQMRLDAERLVREGAERAAKRERAKELLDRIHGVDSIHLIEELAERIDLEALARAITAAEVRGC